VHPYECDIHGIIRQPIWQVIHWVGVAALVGAMAALISPGSITSVEDAGKAIEAGLGPKFTGYGLALLGAIGIVVGSMGKTRHTRHVWVECKDRKTSIKRTDINKLASSVEDVRGKENPDWAPDDVWFASTSRYDQDALAFAGEHGIRCFLLEGDRFVEV